MLATSSSAMDTDTRDAFSEGSTVNASSDDVPAGTETLVTAKSILTSGSVSGVSFSEQETKKSGAAKAQSNRFRYIITKK
ncbi:unknown [Bacteroides sp. CAG:770]|nr:unknown [Bacteroides sp. CAG:770]